MFNQLVNGILSEYFVLEEGIFSLPRRVFQEIIDYYTQMYNKAKIQNTKKITPQNFPPKIFELDLSGTKYEFLNYLKPKVQINFTTKDSYFNTFFEVNDDTTGRIYLGLLGNSFQRMIYDVIEHELLHYIQYLYTFNLYRKNKISQDEFLATTRGSQLPKYGNKFKNVVGLPPKKLLDPRKNLEGDVMGSISRKRAQHSHRPIEYYPDLLSSIRELQFNFIRELRENPEEYQKYKVERPISKISEKQKEIDDKKTLELQKNHFFKKFLKKENTYSISTWVIDSFKKLSLELEKLKNKKKKNQKRKRVLNQNQKFEGGKRKITFYEHMIRLLYDGFVNRDRNFDEKYIYDNLQKINDLYQQRSQQPKKEQPKNIEGDKFIFGKEGLRIDLYDVADMLEGISEETETKLDRIGSTTVNTQDLLSISLSLNTKINKDYGTEYYQFPTIFNQIKKLFKNFSAEKFDNMYGVDVDAGEDIKRAIYSFLSTKYVQNMWIFENGKYRRPTDAEKKEFFDLIEKQ